MHACMRAMQMWNHRIMHWGGRASRKATGPRYSMSVEFQSSSIPPLNEFGVQDPSEMPSFARRVGMIASVVRRYQHMYGHSDGWTEFSVAAEMMAAAVGVQEEKEKKKKMVAAMAASKKTRNNMETETEMET